MRIAIVSEIHGNRAGIVTYAHIHPPSIRSVSARAVANTGSVSLSWDRDARASYLLLDDSIPWIRRVAYDLDKELKALFHCDLPPGEWIAKTLESAPPANAVA
jgi:predicted phosphodiesterase